MSSPAKPEIASSKESIDPIVARATTTPPKKRVDLLFQPRKFHISKADMKAADASPFQSGNSRKRARSTMIFIERTEKKRRALENAATKEDRVSAATSKLGNSESIQGHVSKSPPLKKPGLTSRTGSARPASESPRKAMLPLPEVAWAGFHNDQDLEEVTKQMHAWTLQQMSLSIAEIETTKEPATKSPELKLRPKAPAQRFADRHPGLARDLDEKYRAQDKESDYMDIDEESTDSEDSEYVIEEYIRVPAINLKEAVDPEVIGCIVIEGDEQASLFFGPEADSDEDPEDSEDSNG
jgi:hypothetical protein